MKVKYSDLKNKRIFITGGGSGIGASIVEHFCEQGSEVYFVDIDLKETKKLLNKIKQTAGGDDYRIYPSRSEGNDRNPLDAKDKIELMKSMFPDYSERIVDDDTKRTIFDVLKDVHSLIYEKTESLADNLYQLSKDTAFDE